MDLTSAISAPGCALSRETRRLAARLLDLQLWCWGRDIARREGNALLAHGFARHPPPAGAPLNSAYTLRISAGETVSLRALGLFYGQSQRGGVFVPRRGFEPQLTAVGDLPGAYWQPEQLT